MAYIISDACTNCGACVKDCECPGQAISEKNGKRVIDTAKCLDCGACSAVCPIQAITGE
jgi:TPP-dependent indolepyruvate ferredoxin oxidoreductase alpha subunit